jgi:hypothetical protein
VRSSSPNCAWRKTLFLYVYILSRIHSGLTTFTAARLMDGSSTRVPSPWRAHVSINLPSQSSPPIWHETHTPQLAIVPFCGNILFSFVSTSSAYYPPFFLNLYFPGGSAILDILFGGQLSRDSPLNKSLGVGMNLFVCVSVFATAEKEEWQ